MSWKTLETIETFLHLYFIDEKMKYQRFHVITREPIEQTEDLL